MAGFDGRSFLRAGGRKVYAPESKQVYTRPNEMHRHLNTTGELRDWSELREALDLYRDGAERYIGAVERVLAL